MWRLRGVRSSSLKNVVEISCSVGQGCEQVT
jgi:hypothetical protein